MNLKVGLEKKGLKYSDYFQKNVYPDLNNAIGKLIDYILTTDEVRRHQEFLIQQKVLDRKEQKEIEKERLKEELGSGYVTSEEDDDYEGFRMDDDKMNEDDDGYKKRESMSNVSEEDKSKPKEHKIKLTKDLIQIEENEEQEFEEKEESESKKESKRFEKKNFNPVKFLGEILQKIGKEKRN